MPPAAKAAGSIQSFGGGNNAPTEILRSKAPQRQVAIVAGVPLVTVAGRAGHARTSTTTDIYSHFLKSSDKTAAEKLEQLFE